VAERKPDLARRLGSVLRGAQDRSLGLRAVRAGLITDQELAGPVGVEDLLRNKGIAPEKIRQLHAEIDRDDYALFRPDRAMPGEVSALLGEPDRRLAEFVRVARLGQGGIGEVWKAWDTRLGRWVAIKLPMATPDQEGASERFSREALAAARLSHSNIVSIHRVAEENGRCFIVMQYVEGRPLRGMKLDVRQAVGILRDVALAVHYAHEQGVIHRDLKPGNIVIGADGRPFVLDFGLAHLQEAGRVQSREGLVAGTASYMSPEQARGEPAARERATDVYSLGATLYELVAGRPPYDGASFAETLQKVLNTDLVSPRTINPMLPKDVETVIRKAMDKDPRRRYPTARDLADDLDRVLKDEPITASAMTQTLRRQIKRGRSFVGVAAVLIVLGLAYRAWISAEDNSRRIESEARAREREHELQGFRDMSRLSIQAMLTLRRAGANDRMGEFLTKLEKGCESMRQRKILSPEIEYLLGRGYRAAMEDRKALQAQDRALALSSKYAPALYEKFVLSDGQLKEAELNELRTGQGLEDLDKRTLEGMVAQLYRNSAAARELLEQVVTEDPGRAEAWETLARTSLSAVNDFAPPKEQEEAYRRADEIYTKAVAQDAGFVPFWMKRGAVRTSLAGVLLETGRDPIQIFQGAEDDYTRIIKLGPSVEALVRRALVRANYGVHKSETGGNPLKEFDLADEDLNQAATLHPKDPFVLSGRSYAFRVRAEYKVGKSESPAKELETMEALAAPFIADKTMPAEAWMNVALLRAAQAVYRGTLGEDPMGDFARADQAFGMVQIPDKVTLHAKWARVKVQQARLRVKRRGDPTPDLEKALASLVHVFPMARFYNEAKITQGMYYRAKGELKVTYGSDPTPEFEDSRRSLGDVLEVNPASGDATAERGHLELSWGRFRTKVQDRRGAHDHYANAVRYFEEAMKVNDALSSSLRDWHREARRGMLGAY
jgi:serine/threonine-protein kinase